MALQNVYNCLKIGPQTAQPDGSYPNLRGDAEACLVVAQGHARFVEAVRRGRCYAAQTAATGVAPGTALGTTAAYCLYNPTTSGKLLAVHKLAMGYISGTLGAGVVHITSDYVTTGGAAVPTGTAITPRNLLPSGTTASVATPLTTATITTNAGKAIGILCSLQASLASTAVAPWMVEKDVGGEIVLAPGAYLTLHATAAAGTSPLVVFSATWEEIPLS